MIELQSVALHEFVAALKKCAVVGEANRKPPVLAIRTGSNGLTLTGENSGVIVSRRLGGRFATVDYTVRADLLSQAIAGSVGPLRIEPMNRAVRISWRHNDSQTRRVPIDDSKWQPTLRVPERWQSSPQGFTAALRNASKLVHRTGDHRYAWQKVHLDPVSGRIAATDGYSLFVHGGFDLSGHVPIVIPAIGIWNGPIWKSGVDVCLGFAESSFVLKCGDWIVTLPADAKVKYPRYDELLRRLRAPVARVILSEADAETWKRAMLAIGKQAGTHDPVKVQFANRPVLHVEKSEVVAETSLFLGLRSLQVTTTVRGLARALDLGFRTFAAVGLGKPIVALDGPRRFVWTSLDAMPSERSAPAPASASQ